jgi:Metallo-peptidase family M12/Fibronectin type III domain
MRHFLILFISIFYLGNIALSQNKLSESIEIRKNTGEKFVPYAPFQNAKNRPAALKAKDAIYVPLVLQKAVLSDLFLSKPNLLAFSVPFQTTDLLLELEKIQIITDDFKVKEAASGKVFPLKINAAFYQGIIAGKPNSLVSLTVFENQILAVISDPELGNINLVKSNRADDFSSEYSIYADKLTNQNPDFNCTSEENFNGNNGVGERGSSLVPGCINVSLEAEYEFYTNHGSSISTVVNGLLGVFNTTSSIFNAEMISMKVSEILVWTIPDPYVAGSSTAISLPQFASTRGTNFNGNLAHLIRLGPIEGRAYLDGLCTSTECFGVSHMNSFTQTLNSGNSYPAFVLAHELGHNLGSPHTHACFWNGNNTAIDECSATEGGCPTTPAGAAPSNTIMSYCANTLNFANGFGTQPGNQIRNIVALRTCIGTGACAANPCPAPNNLSIISFPASGSAQFSWAVSGSHTGFNLRYRPQGGAWQTVGIGAPPYTLIGLNPSIVYEVEIQGICSGGNSDNIAGLIFAECIPPTNQSQTVSGTSATLSWTENNGANNWQVKYGNTGFNVNTQGTLTSPTGVSSTTLTGLTNGNCYQWYVRSACVTGSGYTAWAGPKDFGTSPSNDNFAGAITLVVGAATSSTSNCGAGSESGEPNPWVSPGRWNSTRDQSIWYKFQAPASGSVVVSTDFTQIPAANGGNDDPQLAVYQGTTLSNLVMLQSDEDDGELGNGYNNVISLTGLTPNEVYYVQADGWGTTQGSFLIQVSEKIAAFQVPTSCTFYDAMSANGMATNVFSTINPNAAAKTIGAVKTAQNLGTVTLKVKQSTAQNPNPTTFYAGQYYDIQSTTAPNGSTPVQISLIFRQSDLNNLKTLTGNNALTINDIEILHYSGATNTEDCDFANNSNTGVRIVPSVQTLTDFYGGGIVYVLGVSITSFSELIPVVETSALPVELLRFDARAIGNINEIKWQTSTEKNVNLHIIERSSDGLQNWVEVGRKSGKSQSNQIQNYLLIDQKPLIQSYYRLRTLDFDGTQNQSAIVEVNRQKNQFHLQSLFPNPAPEKVNVRLFVPNEGNLRFNLMDMTGRLLQNGIWEAIKGDNTFELLTTSLPSGCYQLMVFDTEGVSFVAKILK